MTARITAPAHDEVEALGYQPQLQRQLGFGSLLVYGLLFFVPLAPVAVFGPVVNRSGGVPVLVYAVAAIVMGMSAVSYREMALRFPTAGSVYGYVRHGAGQHLGFISGWMILLDYLMMPSLLVILASLALAHSIPGIPVVVFTFGFVLASVLLNVFGITVTTRVGLVLLAIQMAVMLAFFGFVAAAVSTGQVHLSAAPLWRAGVTPAGVLSAVSIAALSYLGFDAVATLNEEAKGGGRAVAWATTVLLGVVTVLFCLQVWAAALVSPDAGFAKGTTTTRAFYHAVDAVTPAWFSVVFTLTNAFIAIFACLVVAHASTARLLFAMGRDGVLPRFLGVTTDAGVPRAAVLTTGALALVLGIALAGRAELVTSLVTFGALSSYVFLHAAVWWRCWNQERSGRLVAHLLVPLLGSLALLFALNQTEGLTRTVGLVWLAVGATVLLVQKFSARPLARPQT